jgi:hypothetical protein
MSQQRECYIWKATDQKWYVELGDFEYAYGSENCTRYGPFDSEEDVLDGIDAFSNPGGSTTDTTGTAPPPSDAKPLSRRYRT